MGYVERCVEILKYLPVEFTVLDSHKVEPYNFGILSQLTSDELDMYVLYTQPNEPFHTLGSLFSGANLDNILYVIHHESVDPSTIPTTLVIACLQALNDPAFHDRTAIGSDPSAFIDRLVYYNLKLV